MYDFKRDNLLNVLNGQIATNSGGIVRTNMKRVCGFAVVTHYNALLRRIAPGSVVCRSVYRSVSL